MRIPFFRRAPQTEVDDELAFHVEQRVRDYVARGMDPAAARRAALERLGDLDAVRSECTELLAADHRAADRRDWLDDLRQDVRYGVRSALRAPLFSLLAVVTLALGIGANAAVFRVVKSVLLDALPYADAGRLVRVYARFDASDMERSSISPGATADIARRLRAFGGNVAAFNFGTFDVAYVDAAGARVLSGAAVSGGYFPALGVRAALGRTLTADDGSAAVAVLSHAAWRREFGGDPAVVGRTLRVERDVVRIVGVLPRGYVGPMGDADVVFPMDLDAAARNPELGRQQNYLGVVGRLARGATVASAQRELDRLADELAREHPQTDRGRRFVALPLRDSMAGETRAPLLALLASAGLVLLIACANLAGALLSRTISRRREFAVRVALGARGGRLVRQLLTESTLLALAAAAVGLALAALGLGVLRALALPTLPPYADLSLDVGAVLATLAAAVCTGILFGLAPALSVGRTPHGVLREESRGSSESPRSRRLRGALVATQIALSLSLLAGAGLLVRSLWAMANAPLGFTPDGVMTARVQLPHSAYRTPEERAVMFRQLHERFAAIPGVRAVASVTQIPSPTMSSNVLAIDGATPRGDGPTFIPYMAVSDDYFSLAGVHLLRGRTFGPQDAKDAPPAIVVSESMARRYWPKGDALGARLRVSPHTAERWGVIVGIVRDVRVDPALPAPGPLAYASNRQDDLWNGRDFLLRTTADPATLLRPMQAALAALDPTLPLRDPRPLREIVDERMAGRRLPVVLMTAFGALALVLASVGVYAMFANMAAAREREFGVRVALGSSRGRIAALVLRQGGRWMALGLAGGALGVVVVSRWIDELLYGVSRFDPVALGAAALALVACGAAALLAPVRRATRADPIRALR